jgi:hypothetical protein
VETCFLSGAEHGRERINVRLAAQVQARTQQRTAATGQSDYLLVVAHAPNLTAARAQKQALVLKKPADFPSKQSEYRMQEVNVDSHSSAKLGSKQ